MLKNVPSLNHSEFKWSIERYHRLIETGILTEDDRVELIFGKIVCRSPVGKAHAVCVNKLNRFFYRRFIDSYILRSENPITLADRSEPEPDYVIAQLRPDNYLESHPGPADILLIIEVSEQTLKYDREEKSKLYGAAGIQEYWVINLVDRQVEQFLEPIPGKGFQQRYVWQEKESFKSSLVSEVSVDELLP